MRGLAAYLRSMFPPLLAAAVFAAGIALVVLAQAASCSPAPPVLNATVLLGAASFVLLALLLRVYDELKDYETDKRLAAEGDPNFANRPLVRGDVSLAALVRFRWALTGLIFAVNLEIFLSLNKSPHTAAGAGLALGVFFAVFGYGWLSFHWFFMPRLIGGSLLAAFLTHNPLALAHNLYLLAVAQAAVPQRPLEKDAVIQAAAAFWMVVAAWEIARKVRAPQEETSYSTYSKIIGPRLAALLPAALLFTATCLVLDLGTWSFSPWFMTALLLAFSVVAALFISFASWPERRAGLPLRRAVELYQAVLVLGLLVELLVLR